MHQDYSPDAARVAPDMRNCIATEQGRPAPGKKNDWGKFMPYWCLSCGEGFVSVERVLSHYAEDHGNESTSVGSRGLTKAPQLDAYRLTNK